MEPKTEKIALFMQGSTLYATAKSLGFDIDYKRLLREFQSRGYLLRAFYYTAVIEDQEYSSIRPLIDWLDYNGYSVVTKATKEFVDQTGRRKVKGNMDIELAVDAMEIAGSIDHMVLFSGDGDFRSLVEAVQPGRDGPLCPRLKAFREEWRRREPEWFNAPVASFGPRSARLLIAGLAPGLRGANRTGRPFTGDFAGGLLYDTLKRFGFARGSYLASADDGLTLVDARITNAVRCVPPENKPTPAEVQTCRSFLQATIAEMRNLRAIVTLGRISHDSTLAALNQRRAAAPFGHGASHEIGRLRIFASYHCSRYNTNTGVLTPKMFEDVFAAARAFLGD